jgi:hypothetical protein
MGMESAYELLVEVKGVLAKVPVEDAYMNNIPPHEFTTGDKLIKMPSHWRNGLLLADGSRVIVNRHYYGISSADLGSQIVANVRVMQKTTVEGKKFLMLDFLKTSNGPGAARIADLEIKFSLIENSPQPKEGEMLFPIPGSKTHIAIRPLKKRD